MTHDYYQTPSADLPAAPSAPSVRLWLFMILFVPFGVAAGYVSVAIEYLFREKGIEVDRIAVLASMSVLPHTWKFFWAPVIDATLDQKRWYVIAGVLSSAGVASLGFFPVSLGVLPALTVVVFASSLATTVIGMAVESLMAHALPENAKGRAAGWCQAGNLGGGGIGGGLGLYLAQALSPATASIIVGMLCLSCCLALRGIPSPPRHHEGVKVLPAMIQSLKELKDIAWKRAGMVALILCFLPLGTGAAGGLWAAVAGEWNASADTVALVTGVLGGVVSAVGCLAGGFICDRFDRKKAYVWFGIFSALAAVGMALTPRTEWLFVAWTLIYAFISGLAFAGFSAFVLEIIGKGAAATKFSAFASLSNVPIWYMTLVNGKAHTWWGSNGMLYIEAGMGIAGALLFVLAARLLLGSGGAKARGVTEPSRQST